MASTSHNWKIWHWPWHSVTGDDSYDRMVYSHFAGFGPFQWHWYSYSPKW